MVLDFTKIKVDCHGMLAPGAYKQIYEAARMAPTPLAVEVGTAHGAATIAIALGLLHAGRAADVHTFDLMQGGSRTAYGTREDNVRIALRNFANYCVSENVHLHVGPVEQLCMAVPEKPIGLLMLDADGQLDRDFGLFYDRLANGAGIIIDDYQPEGRLLRRSGRSYSVDLKYRITYELVTIFEKAGLIERQYQVNRTLFCRKSNQGRYSEVDSRSVLAAYKSLVHTTASIPPLRSRVTARVRWFLGQHLPTMLYHLERIRTPKPER